ncbi:UpxY family transcription antiterminator [Leeuwenhoekiella sp. MAR_2009_132]|uniref:UpxY family transcription antiterminator n=1 Tax=Leeuwenhoekiella sp. MAR_2009_132 TaxID=1392489 RepID=UPI00048EC74D|nr:UpxY family transcription antiterminator [Leeuwenhoekiella sp. MAR_2009_132]
MSWYVLYVKSKSEKKVATALQNLGIDVFCPTITELKVWSDRKKKVETPLFKSYIFVNLAASERNAVFAVAGVVRYLFWLGEPAVVRDEEIEVIKNWLDHDNLDSIALENYVPGANVQLTKGVLKGREAEIIAVSGKKMRLYLKCLGMIVEAKFKDVLDE